MPQPISRVLPNWGGVLNSQGGTHAVEMHPALTVLAMKCIATFSTVESWMLELYLDLAGGNKSVAAEMFLKLESRSARSSALEVLIPKLEPRYQNLYRAISKLVNERAKDRDKLAHWVWGSSGQLPDALLLANPRAIATLDFSDPDFREQLNDMTFVYREVDFQRIIARNEELGRFGMLFRYIVNGHPANQEDRLYVRLTTEPAIAEKLYRPEQQDRSPQGE